MSKITKKQLKKYLDLSKNHVIELIKDDEDSYEIVITIDKDDIVDNTFKKIEDKINKKK